MAHAQQTGERETWRQKKDMISRGDKTEMK